ncbi:DUF1702 family protein [Streptomyces griseomycini]|uniref:DUF1702 family protein n=1 Tax=Streptomyces griseomycini TaxID=66895 RepID=UPI0016087A45|nr:DUF1702 family protein [Streptomyces griseomycini]GGQ17369.1 enediyne biosynthesis protein [Streptomyces griseomycini]GGR40964.1 enediyne biosynthesis protein [Streptomyces griseomycini]
MTAALRALRRRILTPALSSTSLEVRGFRRKDPEAQELLETIGRSFLEGYGQIVEAPDPQAAEPRLEAVPRRFRGFAYEGAAMGCSIMDALPGSGGRRLSGLLAGRGGAHTYMAYIGVGWAMARLPRMLHPDVQETDPLLRWLILDGYGFHQAYFHTDRYVHGQHRERKLPWPQDQASYAHRAVDQGIGRALWFVGGTDVNAVLALAGAFAPARRGDLLSGVGLAATYAGGAGADELRRLRDGAGEHRPQLLQGSAFAAEARERAGLTEPHTRLATEVLCGVEPPEAARVCRETRPGASDRVDTPAYETWRQRIAGALVSGGRC